MIKRKAFLFPEPKKDSKEEDKKKYAESLANFMITFASNRPKDFGVYKYIAKDELNELLSVYEEDLKEYT